MDAKIKILTLNTCAIQSAANKETLNNFVLALQPDVVFLQEVSTSHFNCPGYSEVTNVGPAHRGTALLWKGNLSLEVTAKLVSGRGIAAKLGPLSLVNLYAPSGSQGRAARETFFSEDIAPLLANANNALIIAGDMNCILKRDECTGQQAPCTALSSLKASSPLKP